MYFIGKSALSTGCPFILSSNANLFCTEKGPGNFYLRGYDYLTGIVHSRQTITLLIMGKYDQLIV